MVLGIFWEFSKCSRSWLYEISSSTLPLPISKIKLMFSTLWPLSWSIISTTCLVTLALCLSPFSSGGSRNVLPIRSLGSKVGIGLDPDGFSSSLDLMRTVGAFWSGGEPSGSPSADPEEICIIRRVRRCRNLPSMWCKPMVGSGRFLGSNSTSIDKFLGIMIQDFVGHCISMTEFRQPLQVQSHLEMPRILVQLGHIQRT